tara:strand:- start:1 stop:843 length:843 start_codon:yes stop_codon:yes gene_type:complete
MSNKIIENIISNHFNKLRCNSCNSIELKLDDSYIKCSDCNSKYYLKDNKIIASNVFFEENKWEKKNNTYYPNQSIKPIIDRISGPKISSLIKRFKIKGLSINLGSGQDSHPEFINIDLGDYKPVHIVSDISNVPFVDSSIDLIASNSVLEHIYNYQNVIKEASRILKNEGIFYLCVPAVCTRHHEIDYHRWTPLGLQKMMVEDFEIIESGVTRGIAHFITIYISEVIDLKIKNKIFKKIVNNLWRIISLPLFFIKDNHSPNDQAMSETIYIIGKKRSSDN